MNIWKRFLKNGKIGVEWGSERLNSEGKPEKMSVLNEVGEYLGWIAHWVGMLFVYGQELARATLVVRFSKNFDC